MHLQLLLLFGLCSASFLVAFLVLCGRRAAGQLASKGDDGLNSIQHIHVPHLYAWTQAANLHRVHTPQRFSTSINNVEECLLYQQQYATEVLGSLPDRHVHAKHRCPSAQERRLETTYPVTSSYSMQKQPVHFFSPAYTHRRAPLPSSPRCCHREMHVVPRHPIRGSYEEAARYAWHIYIICRDTSHELLCHAEQERTAARLAGRDGLEGLQSIQARESGNAGSMTS